MSNFKVGFPVLRIFFSTLISLFFLSGIVVAEIGVTVSCDAPYFLGQKSKEISSGDRFFIRTVIESREPSGKVLPMEIWLPKGFLPAEKYEYWTVDQRGDQMVLVGKAILEAGYGQWFDIIPIQVSSQAPPGIYTITVITGDDQKEYNISISQSKVASQVGLTIDKILLPLDKDGKKDDRLGENTLVLRDSTLDSIRNILRGEGSSNLEAEAVHPLTHLSVDLYNPKGEQKLVTVTVRLLNYHTHQPEPGLVTPAINDEDTGAENLAADADGSKGFVLISGEERQRLLLPVYADEHTATGGRYLIEVRANDGVLDIASTETEINVVKKNTHAMLIVCIVTLTVLAAFALALPRLRGILAAMKIRWLITISLFSTATFTCVNIPSTVLGDFFHVLLGPFAFLITGLFTGVVLYMLLISLVIIIPRSGVVFLYLTVRMLLGIFAFGHISPASLLSYGLQAVLLELALYPYLCKGVFRAEMDTVKQTVIKAFPLALMIGIADSLSTYSNMQTMIFLYRLHYADWYIIMLILCNGLLYTTIGVLCGVVLGKKLLEIGGD